MLLFSDQLENSKFMVLAIVYDFILSLFAKTQNCPTDSVFLPTHYFLQQTHNETTYLVKCKCRNLHGGGVGDTGDNPVTLISARRLLR